MSPRLKVTIGMTHFFCSMGLLMVFSGGVAFAHHSNSLFEVLKIETVTGKVTKWLWINPHTWLYMDVTDEKGVTREYQLEGRPPGTLLRNGWSKSSIKVDDVVTADFNPAKDGTRIGLLSRVKLPDGTLLLPGSVSALPPTPPTPAQP